MYIQRSKAVPVVRLIWPILLLILDLILYFFLHSPSFAIVVFLIALLWIGLSIINYFDDVFILTNKRIIDIDRKFIFFGEDHTSVEYGPIKDVIVDVGSPLFRALDVGKVIVQTPGDNPDIEISPADHPFFIQDKIFALKGIRRSKRRGSDDAPVQSRQASSS